MIKPPQDCGGFYTFINKIYFREVTSQIQGIEIYQKFHQAMNICAGVPNQKHCKGCCKWDQLNGVKMKIYHHR